MASEADTAGILRACADYRTFAARVKGVATFESMSENGKGSVRRTVRVRRVDECETLDELFTHCLPAFGGAYLRRIYTILDRAIGMGCPLTLAIAGPVTVSGQHQTWLIPLLETGWVAYLSTTDAVCYHDGHRSLDGYNRDPIHEVPIFSDDAALARRRHHPRHRHGLRRRRAARPGPLHQRVAGAARVPEEDDRHRDCATGWARITRRRRSRTASQPGCSPRAIGWRSRSSSARPADGSVFLNSMKLWAMRQAGLIPDYDFDLDLHAEVFEACAYHRWGLFDHPAHALATLILGGGVPKNYNLQPEPALGQVLGLPDVRGYNFDVQIVTAPVTDGSLSSCPPAEAVTWGKVDKDTYLQTTESMQADYSMVMPFLVKALLDNRERYAGKLATLGEETVFAEDPKARGYLRPREGYRLFEQREELCRRLTEDVRSNRDWLRRSVEMPSRSTSW